MNAPVKHASLESLYAQRKALLAKRAETATSREKLADSTRRSKPPNVPCMTSPTGRLTRSKSGRRAVAAVPRPCGDFGAHHALERKFIEAQHQAAKASLGARARQLGEDLFENRRALDDAAAVVMAGELKQMGDRANVLRDELKDLEAKLLAARDYFGQRAEEFYKDNHTARAAFVAAHDAAAQAYGEPLAPGAFANGPRHLVVEIEAQLDAPVEGK